MTASLPAGELRPDETEAVVALWERCGLTRPWNDPYADIALAMRGPASTVLVIRHEAGIAASAMVGHNGHRAWAYYVCVDPQRRSRGLGRAIMQACEDWARARDMPKIQILVRNGNLAVAGFYGAVGYAQDDVVAFSKWLNDGGPAAFSSD